MKKGIDDKAVIVSPENVKKLADGKVIEVTQADEKADEGGTESAKTVLLYLPKKYTKRRC